MLADDLCTTDAERACLAALRAALGGADSPMERHCVRQFRICEQLAGDEPYDREVLLCACWLHDAGLATSSSDAYVTEAARMAKTVLEPFGWEPERLRLCMDACEMHHAPTSQRALGLEVELVRQSDLVDVSAGLVRFGLERSWLKTLAAELPRKGFYGTLARAVGGELRHRPRSLGGVFVRPGRPRASA